MNYRNIGAFFALLTAILAVLVSYATKHPDTVTFLTGQYWLVPVAGVLSLIFGLLAKYRSNM